MLPMPLVKLTPQSLEPARIVYLDQMLAPLAQHQMRHVMEERTDKIPKSLIARTDHSYRPDSNRRVSTDLLRQKSSITRRSGW